MQISALARIAWQIAALEAKQSGFNEIEPDHFFIAILKLADVPNQELQRIAPHDSAHEIATEKQELVETLAANRIDPTTIRRLVRTFLQGNYTGPAIELMHRSQALRKLFAQTEKQAEEKNLSSLTTLLLLQAILTAPSAILRAVLGESAQPKIEQPAAPCGRDFFELEPQAQPNNNMDSAAGIAIYAAMKKKKHIILVHNDEQLVRAALFSAVRHLLAEKADGKDKVHIVDLSECFQDRQDSSAIERIWTQIAKSSQNSFYYIPAIESTAAMAEPTPWAGKIKSMLLKKNVRLICRVADMAVLQAMNEPDIKRNCHVIRLRDDASNEIPQQL